MKRSLTKFNVSGGKSRSSNKAVKSEEEELEEEGLGDEWLICIYFIYGLFEKKVSIEPLYLSLQLPRNYLYQTKTFPVKCVTKITVIM